MNHGGLSLKLVRRRRSFSRIGRLCIIVCALFICCIGGKISVSAGSTDEGQPTPTTTPSTTPTTTPTPSSSSQKPQTNSWMSLLWPLRGKQPQTPVSSVLQNDVATELPPGDNTNDELKANISVEPIDLNRELGSADSGFNEFDLTANFFSCSFEIYSRNKSIVGIKTKNNGAHLFELNELAPKNGVFNASRRTVILIPGFRSTNHEQWMENAKNLWLELEDVNVILVFWNQGSNGFYPTAVKNTRIVSQQIVILLYYLAKLNHIDFHSEQFRQSIYLVGHSCGSHIAGFVGRALGGKVDRITGLDPAGPIFATLNATERLNAKNAKLVDIIHTNSGKSLETLELYKSLGLLYVRKKLSGLMDMLKFSKDNKNQLSIRGIVQQAIHLIKKTVHLPIKPIITYGIEEQIGHIDYYVNGGSLQPDCNDQLFSCDHSRAIEIYLRILEYQLKAKQNDEGAKTPESMNKQADLHRLVAFAANDYEDYKTGASLVRNCPEISLSSPAAEENLSDESFGEAFERCTIPIDFVKPADDYRKELPAAVTSGDSDRAARYYFDTLAHDPFVSDYYLMRLHVPSLVYGSHDHRWLREQDSKVGQCRLFSSLHSVKTDNMHRFSSQLAEYRPWNYTAPDGYYSHLFIGLILPLLNPNDWRHHFPMRKQIYQQIQATNKSDEAADELRLVLPNALATGLIQLRNQQRQQTNAAIDNNATQTDCNISYSDIELIPLSRALNRSFSLWFSLESGDDCQAELNSTTARKPIIINKPYEVDHSISLNWTEQVCNIPLKAISLLSQA